MKLKLDSVKKGYFHIDVMFVLLVFLILFYFVYDVYFFYIDEQDNFFHNTHTVSMSNDLCQYLTKTSGLPVDWESDISNLQFIGLKNLANYSLNTDKLNALNSTNYDLIKDNLVLKKNFFIEVKGVDTNIVYSSIGSFPTDVSKGNTYICYSNYNDEMVKVFVGVW